MNHDRKCDSTIATMMCSRASELELAAKTLREMDCAELIRRVEIAQKSMEQLLALMPLQDEASKLPFKLLHLDKLGDVKGWVHQMYETLRQLNGLNH